MKASGELIWKSSYMCVITKEGSKDMWQYPEYLNPEGEYLQLGKGMGW